LLLSAFAQDKPGTPYLFKTLPSYQQAAEEDNPIDVQHYDVSLHLDFSTQKIIGKALISIKPQAGADLFYLHLTKFDIDSISLNGREIRYSVQSDRIYFHQAPLDTAYLVQINYSGTPGNDGFGGFFFKDNWAYTMGEGLNSYPPSMLRCWIPSHDVPFDKATIDLHITVPQHLRAFANGTFISSENHADGTKTVTWQENHPIATYLVALAVGPYETFSIPYQSISGIDLPLEFYVYPEHLHIAQEDWKNITLMMGFYERAFGAYPFDRYSMAEANNRGAMEHQTMTTYSSQLVTGDHRYDYIVAHELAHHWWGDLITLGDWKDIWLNEGFATYSEALYFEHLFGKEFYQNYMNNLAEIYFRETARLGHFSIYNPDYLWGGTVYQKGAWVLHMLRWTIGDEAFWQTLNDYRQRYAYGNAVTTDFIRVAEQESGQDLDWFFDQWIFQPGCPDLDISWDFQKMNNDNYAAVISFEQKQWDQFRFQIPIEVSVETTNKVILDTLWLTDRLNSFTLELSSRPISISIDPNNWLLKHYDIISGPKPPGVTPEQFYLSQNYPNPFSIGQKSIIVFYVAQLNAPHPVEIKIYNILGREIKTLFNRQALGGFFKVEWDGRDEHGRPAPKGVYIYRLISNDSVIEKKMVLIE